MPRKLAAPVVALAMIGASGLALIKGSEGTVYRTYLDPAGIPTACTGHTGPEVRMGQVYTPVQCDALLRRDIVFHQNYLVPGRARNCIGNVPLNQNQLDALTSFTFNVGPAKFCSSTMALRLRHKQYRLASPEFLKWDKARVNGKLVVLPGLAKRRREEKRLFDTPSTPGRPNVPSGALRAIMAQSH